LDSLVGSVTEVIHLQVKLDRVIYRLQHVLRIVSMKMVIIQWVKLANHCRGGKGFLVIVDEPASDIRVETGRDGVEQVLDRQLT
jgi:hypothetical protein